MEKILIIRLSSIGDIVLTTPVIRCLKYQLPGCRIHFLTKLSYAGILQENPNIDKVFSIKSRIEEVLPLLRMEQYDHIVDLHKNFRSLKVRMKLGVRATSFPKLNIRKWLLVNLKIDLMPPVHIVDRYFKSIKSLNVENDGNGLDFYINEKNIVQSGTLPDTHQKGFIGLVIGGRHTTKKLPVPGIIELCGLIDYPVIILGGPEDKDVAETIAFACGGKVINGCGTYNLGQSASLVQQAKLVITHDTGLMHIAAAYNKKIISIWGNTIPALGMYPYMPVNQSNSVMFEVKGLSCRPCSKIGFEKCPKRHFKCMTNQNLRAIALKARELLK